MKARVRGDVLKLDDTICWMCGKKFNDQIIKERKTFHHVVPQRFKPYFNILIPFCQRCHYLQNQIEIKYKFFFADLKNVMDRKQKSFDKWEEQLINKEKE